MNIFLRLLSVVLVLFHLSSCSKPPSDGVSAQDLATHNQAVGLMGQFKYEEAHLKLSGLVQQYPRNSEFQVDLAIATLNRQQEGDEAAALKILGKVLQRAPRHLRAHYCSGLLKLNGGQATLAAPHFTQVTDADPQDAYAAYYLALSLAQQSQNEASLQWYRKAIERDPHLRSGYYGAFQVMRRLRRADEAKEMLDLYQRLSTNPRAHNAEFKYTQMGPKAVVQVFPSALPVVRPIPEGPLFAERQSLPIVAGEGVAWRSSPDSANLTAADINGDGRLDLFATDAVQYAATHNGVLIGESGNSFRLQLDHPLAAIPQVNTALWGDIDNDGLIDVYLCRRGPNQLWRQKSPGQWEEITSATTANGEADTVDGALFDADHDGDLDLFLVNNNGPNELLNNNRDGTFRPLAGELKIGGRGQGGRSILVTDLDRDRDADLLVFNDRPPHEVYLNDLLWSYRPAPGFDALRASPVAAALAQDRNADGRPELYTLSANGDVIQWRKDVGDQWRGSSLAAADQEPAPADTAPGPAASLALVDVDGDGATELLRSTSEGWSVYRLHGDHIQTLARTGHPGLRHWILFAGDIGAGPAVVGLDSQGGLSIWPPGPGRNRFAGLRLSGMEERDKSMRSNASGIGAHLALRTGAQWTVMDSFRNHTGPGQSLQPLTIGLGGAEKADFVAIEWSDGVFQSELNLESGRLHAITETQRQLSSCPVLFVWNGERYQFVSDILGVGGIGFAIGRGEYAESRPWENFQLPQDMAQPRGGRYLIKLTEPMEEATYLDAARLIQYDLPPGWQMVLDERMSINGPEPNGEPRFYRNEMLPDRVTDQRDRDVTAKVTIADLQAAPAGRLDQRFIGRLAEEQRLILEFPRPLDVSAGEPMLVIDGWVEYPYSQTMFAAWQADAEYLAPSLDVWGKAGQWRPLLEQFGYPAGMPRRMSLPLAGLPAGVSRLRLRTNQEIYWDRIAVAYAEPLPGLKRLSLPLRAARVQANGFPLRTTGAQRLPRYDYGRRLPLWDTRYMAGFYTEYGDAEPLVSEVDDALAIFGPGEEIHLEFEAPREPTPDGWSRILVFESNGWAKDMDLFTRDGNSLTPLPTRGGSSSRRDQLHARFNKRYRSGS